MEMAVDDAALVDDIGLDGSVVCMVRRESVPVATVELTELVALPDDWPRTCTWIAAKAPATKAQSLDNILIGL